MKAVIMGFTVNTESEHLYKDIDGIRLVFDPSVDKVVGWYRPDGWDGDELTEDQAAYAKMARGMIE